MEPGEREVFLPNDAAAWGGASPSPSSTGDNGDGGDTYEEDDTPKMSGKFSDGAALP